GRASSDVSLAEDRTSRLGPSWNLHVLLTTSLDLSCARSDPILVHPVTKMHALRHPLRLPINHIVRHVSPSTARLFGTSATRKIAAGQAQEPKSAALSPRWLTDLRDRINKCLSLQLGAEDAGRLRERLDYLDRRWLELSAGREGFLTTDRWRGLNMHAVTWGDMVRHVNNVIYNRYAESGRVNWITSFANATDSKHRQQWVELMTPKSVGLILRSIKTDYKLPMTYPDNVTVLHKLAEKPNYSSDSIILEAIILSERHQRPAARCFEDIAVYDYQEAKKAPLKDFMVDELRATYELQEHSKEDVERKVAQLNRELEQIEEDRV
ncbi:hypothetical protein TOPH_08272, partial [Tolypocladium ophioglossoides CBS 100239]